jgi:hypothetical protein
MTNEKMAELGGILEIQRKWLTHAEMTERNGLLGQLEVMPPASQVHDFVPGWPAPGKQYQETRRAILARLDELVEIATRRAAEDLDAVPYGC